MFGPMLRRVVGAALLGVVAVETLTGCTVESGAVAGVGVDADGNSVGYLQVCVGDAHIDGATVYTDGANDNLGSWQSSTPVDDFTSWSMTEPDGGWRTLTPLATLKDKQYALYGWTKDDTWSAVDVTFRADDLARLEPGQVLYSKYDGSVGSESGAVVDVQQFRDTACDTWF